jgi:hypothetical protein
MSEETKNNKNEDSKKKILNWVEFLVNVKYGEKILKKGDKLQVSPVQANILNKESIARKL